MNPQITGRFLPHEINEFIAIQWINGSLNPLVAGQPRDQTVGPTCLAGAAPLQSGDAKLLEAMECRESSMVLFLTSGWVKIDITENGYREIDSVPIKNGDVQSLWGCSIVM